MNCTAKYCLSEIKLEASLRKYTAYFFQGLLLALINFPLFLAITRHRSLRDKKEYLIAAGLLFINGMTGVSGTVGGGLRSFYIIYSTANQFKSRWQCFCTPFQQLWTWTDMLGPLSCAVISCDRLLGVLVPFHYFGWGPSYAYLMWGAALFFTFGWYIWAALMVKPFKEQIYPSICSQDYSHDPLAFQFLQTCRFVFITVSLVLYPIVLILYRKHSSKIEPTRVFNSQQQIIERRRFRRMTVSLGISSAVTFMFFFIPQLIELYMSSEFSFEFLSDIGPILYLMYCIDPLSDTFIFIFRHKEIRLACLYTFKCRTLTQARLNQIETTKNSSSLRVRKVKPFKR